MKEKNYLRQVGVLTLLVMGVLTGMSFLPRLSWQGHVLRRVDLLSDVRPKLPVVDTLPLDTLPPVQVKPAFVDTCPAGKTCIEDYSDSTLRGMTPFYRALREADKRPVRIAYFGDSFIEGDILTADLRALFQDRFGGCGVGFVPITSMVNGFRPTVRHTFGGWSSHSITDTVYFDRSKQGVSGHYFVPQAGATVELRGTDHYAAHLDTFAQASLYYYSRGTGEVEARLNRDEKEVFPLDSSAHLQTLVSKGRIGRVRWTVNRADSVLFYGTAADGQTGIALDNFSLRGSSGLNLRSVPMRMMREFNRERPYDLIIVQYGLNVATERGSNYNNYYEGMRTTLQHVKEAFPQAAVLVVSVADRDYRTEDGELRTMPGIRNLVRYQQRLAAAEQVAFWNMWQAMGGESSMAALVHAEPAKANLDYTHINFRGGKHLAALLFEALTYGYEQFERKEAYEEQ